MWTWERPPCSHFLYPLFAALLGRVFYRERLSGRKKLALLMATGGLAFFGGGLSPENGSGATMALLSGVCYAFYMVMMERKGLAAQDTATVTLYLALVVSAAVLVPGAVSDRLVLWLPGAAYLLAVLIAAATSFGAVALLQIGVRCLSATTAACFCLLEPVSSLVFGHILLGNPLTWEALAGSGIILAALALFARG